MPPDQSVRVANYRDSPNCGVQSVTPPEAETATQGYGPITNVDVPEALMRSGRATVVRPTVAVVRSVGVGATVASGWLTFGAWEPHPATSKVTRQTTIKAPALIEG
jgi:hypothetical protein